ncbi:toxin biosynthesis protein [Colletotrichum tofieldiae]|uniref:Toxin biosynthesis protein n=1 Tax=Colletotrichum tofieldiae TaxID=708197 RepID=A0A166SCM6_9PEZI|nr:toxin biosynthesis protein [Colletotrichum tofieldiae]
MALAGLAWPSSWFFLSTALFFLSLRQEARHPRMILAALHLLAVIVSLLGTDIGVLEKLPPFVVPFAIGVTVHTTSLLLLRMEITTAGLPLVGQLKAAVLVWSDIRRSNMQRFEKRRRPQSAAAPSTQHPQGGISFGLERILRALALWLLDRYIYEIFITRTLGSLPLGISSFAPANQALFPGSPWASSHFTRADLILRAVTCTHWIWSTYSGLTVAHHACAALFVSVLVWDSPEDWASQPLFGSVWDAYTLRRFWGVFWQRLHVVPFSACTPPWIPKALRALWVFLLSAACHALANWVLYRRACALSEVRFFVSNWAVCLLETACGLDDQKAAAKPGSTIVSWGRRLVGLGFVWTFFFCTVPAWQYPVVLASS